jgi:hypothetical protein
MEGMMNDDIEALRLRDLVEVNSSPVPEGQTWTTDELCRDFEVQGFLAPYVLVRRKSDGQIGTLQFKHSPRIYFGWVADKGE